MKTIFTKSAYFNFLNRSDKAKIKWMIVTLGYTDVNELDSHIVECRIARRFNLRPCLKEVIEHYEQSSSKA